MKAMLRLGSAWYDVASQIKAITEQGLGSRNFILCTDDSHSGTLVDEGHMNRVVRHAIAQGLPPVKAIVRHSSRRPHGGDAVPVHRGGLAQRSKAGRGRAFST
jgi:adenine deaminase